MTGRSQLTKEELKVIDDLVQHYRNNIDSFSLLTANVVRLLSESKKLKELIHSVRWRVKDPRHLRDKLIRKAQNAKESGHTFDITCEGLFEAINDLSGVRILHLYTRQIQRIDEALRECLDEARYPILEGPIAKTWDDESRGYFSSIGIATEESRTLYTSVHYVIASNTRTSYTCELQVRTLAEELWGEVDHTINYPSPSSITACREQIAVLARITSSCTRLVDSIFRTHDEGPKRRRRQQ